MQDAWQQMGTRHVLKNLELNAGRLAPSNPEFSHTPQTDCEWCKEALASHDTTPLNGIIVSDAIERTYRKNLVGFNCE